MMADFESYLLIVDDHPEVCKLLAYCFEDEGLVTRMALSGEQAIRAICIQTPVLIFMDFKMPEMNGLEMLKKVQHLIYNVPVIMSSAETDPDAMHEIQSTGQARYFVSKPFEIASLKQLVKQILASPARALEKTN